MLVAWISDSHHPYHHGGLIDAFEAFCRREKPDVVVFGGDIADLATLKRFEPEEDDPATVQEEILAAVRFMNGIDAPRKFYLPGNHEARWKRALYAGKARLLRGLIGLDLQSQFHAQGLDRSIRWVREDKSNPGLFLGRGDSRVLYRHGDQQAKGPGRPVMNIATGLLRDFPGVNLVVGHHHRAQLACQTVLGRTTWAVTSPRSCEDFNYAPGPNWQRGFVAVEHGARFAHPHILLAAPDGSISWGRGKG